MSQTIVSSPPFISRQGYYIKDYLVNKSCRFFFLTTHPDCCFSFVMKGNTYVHAPTVCSYCSFPDDGYLFIAIDYNRCYLYSTRISMLLLFMYVIFSDLHLLSQRKREIKLEKRLKKKNK